MEKYLKGLGWKILFKEPKMHGVYEILCYDPEPKISNTSVETIGVAPIQRYRKNSILLFVVTCRIESQKNFSILI